MPPLPTGHVALLFTDVAGSTRGWETYGDEYGRSLARHFKIAQDAVARNGGAVFKTVGDQVCAVFPDALRAIRAALDGQHALGAEHWPAPIGPIRVRMAIHSGDPLCRDRDYFGPPVNRIARLLNAASPGQVLVSLSARSEIPPEAGVEVKSLGVHMLKDLLQPEAIFQVTAPGEDADFPPPRTLDARPHNLPAQLTSFVGRGREIEELAERLADPGQRLVTLMGPPGVGKTRLAVQFAAEYAYRYPDGVWLVELASVRDPAAVAHQVEAALGMARDDGRHTTDRLYDALAQRQLLLVFDNFEHVLPAADVVSGILRTTRTVQILVTSRSLLRVSGESVLEVQPLQTAEPSSGVRLIDLASSAASALFVERASTARPGWTPSEAEATDVAVICRDLDGLPLAIELAAARLRSMSIGDIRSRLSHRLRLLSVGGVDLPERQRTLRAALDWSFDLMAPAEREALAQISVFRGGFTLEAAEAVCNAGDVWDIVPSLHDQSFLVAREQQGHMRYDMLEVIREYATERVGSAAAALKDRHSNHYVGVAEAAAASLDTLDDAAASERLETEIENIRAAIGWACESGNAATCARLTVAVAEFLNRRGWWLERLDRLSTALAIAQPALEGEPITAWLVYHQANALADVGRLDEATAAAADSLRRARSLPDLRLEAWSLILTGFLAEKRDDQVLAERHYVEAAEFARAHDDAFSLASSLTNRARLADLAGQWDRAMALLRQSLDLWRKVGSARGLATALTNLGCIADEVEGGRAEQAGDSALAHERREAAIRLFGEALDLQMKLRNLPKIALLLNNIAEALERDDRVGEALPLYYAAERIFRQAGSPKAEYVSEQLARAQGKVPEAPAAVAGGADRRQDPLRIAAETVAWAYHGPKRPAAGMITPAGAP